MFGIPYQRITINSPLTPVAISQCFRDLVWDHSPSWIGETPTDKKLVGKWSFDSFQIQKIRGVHKSIHNPIFYGKINSAPNGSKIDITITISTVNFLILLAVNIFTLLLLVNLLLNEITAIITTASFLGIFNFVGYWVFRLESEEIEFEIRKKLLPNISNKNYTEVNTTAPFG